MVAIFYLAALLAVFTTVLVIRLQNPVHALLCLVTSLLSLAVSFFALGAPLAAALEILVYAGAILVLFVFVIMLLNQDPRILGTSHRLGAFLGLLLLALVLTIAALCQQNPQMLNIGPVPARQVVMALFQRYGFLVELLSLLLLAGLVAAYSIGFDPRKERREHDDSRL